MSLKGIWSQEINHFLPSKEPIRIVINRGFPTISIILSISINFGVLSNPKVTQKKPFKI